jgi:LPS sulfotransferase NodH
MLDWLLKHGSYTRFVVITKPRTGSNLLINGLQSHPQMKVFGELFRGGVEEAVKDAVRLSASGYFNTNVFKRYPASIKAVGFKIFYHHPVWDPTGGVWRYLHELEDLKVIHLKRKNLLRLLVSSKVARKTDIWKQSAELGKDIDKRVEISAEECLEFFRETLEQQDATDEKFGGKALMQLTYEDLTADFQGQMSSVQDFLGVTPVQLPAKTVKQNPDRLDELIVNYGDLKHALRGSRWESFLE